MSSVLRLNLTGNKKAFFNQVQNLLRTTYNLKYEDFTKKYTIDATIKDHNKIKKFTADDEVETINKLKQAFQKDEKAGVIVPTFKKALLYGNKVAIKDDNGEYTYGKLFAGAKKLSSQISNICGSGTNARIIFLTPNDVRYTVVQFAIWFSGHIAVPLSKKHPPELLKYFVDDCEASILITTSEYEALLKPIADALKKILIVVDKSVISPSTATNVDDPSYVSYLDPKNCNIVQFKDNYIIDGTLNNEFYSKSNAMILYTSGTTGKPKGVVLTHKNIDAQVTSLTNAWQMNEKDCLLHLLPLNHVHGCINSLILPLSIGASVVMQEKFCAQTAWKSLLGINLPAKDRVNVFMAVPTIYNMLIDEYEKIFAKNSRMVEYIENHCKKNIRLMVSGSSPLPTTVFNSWHKISGHYLLERYGMTEIGMALSNPYITDKIRKRMPAKVGLPLPSVECKIVDPNNQTLFTMKGEANKGFWANLEQPVYASDKKLSNSVVGELQVKGPSVFKEYYNLPEATRKEFVDGYFKTGDIVTIEEGVFKVLGRNTVDIIKTGGYKVSALEIETQLLTHPNIKEVAVIGIDDPTWGQKIAALCVLRDNTELDLESFKVFCSDKLAPYQIPSILKLINELPKNTIGKVNKKDLCKIYFSQTTKEPIQTKN